MSGESERAPAPESRGHDARFSRLRGFAHRRRKRLIVVLVVALVLGGVVGWARYSVAAGDTEWRQATGDRELLDADSDRILLHDTEGSLEIRDLATGEVTAAFSVETKDPLAGGGYAIDGWDTWILMPGGVVVASYDNAEIRMVNDGGQAHWSHTDPFVGTEDDQPRLQVLAVDRASEVIVVNSCADIPEEGPRCVVVALDTATGDVRWSEPSGASTLATYHRAEGLTESTVVLTTDPDTVGTRFSSDDAPPVDWQVRSITDGEPLGEPFTAIGQPRSNGEHTLAMVDDCEFSLLRSGEQVPLTGNLPTEEFGDCELVSGPGPSAAVIRAALGGRDDRLATGFSLDLASGEMHQLAIEDRRDRIFPTRGNPGLTFDRSGSSAVWRVGDHSRVFDARSGEEVWSVDERSGWTFGPDATVRMSEYPAWRRILGGARSDAMEFEVRGRDGAVHGSFVAGRAYAGRALPDGGFVYLTGANRFWVRGDTGPDELIYVSGP